jgi:ketosteroid isomerase-like protein
MSVRLHSKKQIFIHGLKMEAMTTIIKKISEEFSEGNFSAAFGHFDDNIQWEIVGDKIVKGKEDVIEFCNKMTAEMASSQLDNTNIVTENDRVAIEGNCKYVNAEHKPAQVRYCDVYTFENEKIKGITSYCIFSLIAS